MEEARLFAFVMLVMGPNLGRTLFSLLIPLIPAASTKFVTKVGKGMCLFSVGKIPHYTPYHLSIINNLPIHYLIQELNFLHAW